MTFFLDANLFFDLEANRVAQFGALKTSPTHQQFYFNTIISNELLTGPHMWILCSLPYPGSLKLLNNRNSIQL
jgi:hypothetical protein